MNRISHILPARCRAYFRHPRIRSVIASALWLCVVVYFVFCGLILATRWYLLPQIDRYKDDIAELLTRSLSGKVTIGSISPRWESFWPTLEMTDVRIDKSAKDSPDTEVLVLPKVSASVYWRSIFGTPQFRHLTVSNAELTVRRLSDKLFDVAGFELNLPDLKSSEVKNSSENENLLFEWLLKQGRIDFIDGTVRYFDLTLREDNTAARSTRLGGIALTFKKNVTDYALGLQATIEDGSRNRVDIRARFGKPVWANNRFKNFSGEVYAAVARIDIGNLLSFVAPVSEVFEKGRGSARVWANFSNGKIDSLTSDVFLRDVTLHFSPKVRPLELERFSTHLKLDHENNTLRIQTTNLKAQTPEGLKLPEAEASAELVLNSEQSQTTSGNVLVSFVDLNVLRRTLDSAPLPPAVADWIRSRSPEGGIKNARISWQGPVSNTTTWAIEGILDKVTVNAQKAEGRNGMVPGFKNISGAFTITPKTGLVTLDSQSGSITIPDVFSEPEMLFDSLKGKFGWALNENAPLQFTISDVEVVNADARATAHGTWTANDRAGRIDLSGTVNNGKATSVWKYMPKVVGADTQKWLKAGLVTGTADGRYELIGDLNDFPWTNVADKTKGHFLVDLEVKDAAIDYVPSYKVYAGKFQRGAQWPLLTNINGTLTFEGANMTVRARSAKTYGADVGPTTAQIPDLSAGRNVLLKVRGQASANLQDMFYYLEASPVGGYIGNAFKGTRADGRGELKLDLDIPLLHAKDTQVHGAVTMAGNNVQMPNPIPPLTDVQGTVEFTHKGASARHVTARAFGQGNVTANVITTQDGTITISASGQTDVKPLTFFAPVPAFEETMRHAEGQISFVTSVSIKRGGEVTVVAESTLKGMSFDAPAPLAKKPDDVWPTLVSVSPISVAKNKGLMVRVESDKRFDVMLQLPVGASKLPNRGSVAVGQRAGLPRRGIAVTVNADRLSADEWFDPLLGMLTAVLKTDTSADSASSSKVEFSGLKVKAKQLSVKDARIKNLSLSLDALPHETYRTIIDSDKAVGSFSYERKDAGSVALDLMRADIDAPVMTTAVDFFNRLMNNITPEAQKNTASRLPNITGNIGQLTYAGKKLGAVQIESTAQVRDSKNVLEIHKLNVTNEAARLTSSGLWEQGASNLSKDKKSRPGTTKLSASLEVTDTGDLLSLLGYPGVIQDANGSAMAELTWNGTPWDPVLETVNGSLALDLRKGAFEQIDTGPGGALLSLISFQSLLKQLTLDFTVITQKGFTFDSFVGTSTIRNGVMSSDNTEIIGTHGTVLLDGQTDLARRTIDSHVVVLPDINAGNASLALSFVNPAVGIGTFLAQMVLRKPLSRLFSIEYKIDGSWEEPVIRKLEKQNTNQWQEEP